MCQSLPFAISKTVMTQLDTAQCHGDSVTGGRHTLCHVSRVTRQVRVWGGGRPGEDCRISDIRGVAPSAGAQPSYIRPTSRCHFYSFTSSHIFHHK